MKALDEPPYLTVGTDVSAKYRGAFCEAKIKTAKRLVKVKVTFRHDSSTLEVQDDHIKGPLKVGTVVEVRNPDGIYQEAVINKLTDASWYTVVFDDGDEKTLRRSSLCLKGERHFAESETLDQLPLTNPEHFGTPVIGKKTNRGRRSNHIPEEESSSSSSDEDEDDRKQTDELLGKVVCVETVSTDKKKNIWFPALVVCPDCSDEVAVKKDNVLVRSFKDGKFSSVPRKDVREISESSPKPDAALKQAFDQALEFCKNRTVPSNWKTELKEESSSSEAEEEDEDEKDKEDNSSEEEAKTEPFPEERENFLQQLYKFMEDRGTPINKRPVLGYRNLNLFKLFRLVHKLGGFDNIESGAVWKQVYQDLGIPVLNSAAGYNVKCAYKKYLYGFEEYCTSANVEFKMALPEKTPSKPCKEHEQEVKKQEEVELNIKETKVKNEEKDDEITTMNKQVILTENENEKKENDKTSSLGIKKCFQEPPNDQEKELTITITNDETNMECKEDTECKNLENQNTIPETEEREISNDVTIKEEDEDEEGEEEEEEEDEEEEEEDDKNEEEEFECYPPGMKVQVRYGRGKNQKMYEASIKDSDIEGGEVLYLVHYCGWNVRYDEWIKADKIVRPADKNVPKIKHRKKIKNKADKDEKYSPKAFKLRRSSKPPFHVGISPEMASKPDSAEAKTSELIPNKSLEIISILNGLQASESSDDSEQDDDQSAPNVYSNGKEDPQDEALTQDNNEVCLKEQISLSMPEEAVTLGDATASKPVSKSPERPQKELTELSDDTDYDGDHASAKKRKEIKKEATDKIKRGKRRYCVPEECLKTGSPNSKDEKSNGKDILSLENSSNSSSDEDEVKNKLKLTPNKKYNGLDDKRKSLRTNAFYPGFSEVSEKRIKLLSNSDERLQNTRAKDRKDVWSSIQGQWPKKTLKELFSDSDTEAAASPPHTSPEQAPPEEHLQTLEEEDTSLPDSKVERSLPLSTDAKPVEEKPAETNDKKVEFPSSGSNSVLNTPPTTPESPPSVTVADSSRHQSGISVSETLAPSQEEVRSIKSETDSTIEVDSIVGELQDLQSEGNVSPTGFDASVSSSSSNQPEHTEKACTGQKRHKDNQGGGPSKKQKRSHKTSVVNNKKKNKSTNSSDSEELSAGESITKSQPAKSVSTGVKSQHTKAPARIQSPGKCGKNGEKDSDLKEQNSRLPKLYKWSFQLSDLENMTSAERISILQEKLQEIRKHYMSLKSEVASIDRRRKRLKKKERESAATTSSSSSSPSSSTITAAVMLSLADPPVSNSSQNGMSVECR
ncbi:AT-rich interactive domain-containing protein 4B isoform X1 [Ahaetulla prasina]|uniref:AT-rich interactive domain-containing protein 4B isoform X1 n=1 Tax=Ahaetulla prasina TaxID=499056 RepID=UPI002649DCF6|nr:AT-rich interactive domain-containing protein 4B isoform X1 [Ahaetulla prasina]XP_058022168.1 AT-rich interactive domain-containing protein 4B isoform X2 [Ahaetulla prasina]XP_058022176.1 AT-rich interactive domain-containing protein 4B isoform X1 [Ahaetulla prasina]